ncbi:hypothetical protein [Acetobacter persici]|uniref:DUF1653 domain-containing protein n=1 Tax=Acetobacter persici TaxID=1076596 RepID=A0A1U9LJ88_9PROT|nr:hypothetical protein [Acetobacter persici]AQT06467.1 hypothetical protein A0U91_15755 [Acetobacter persici]
MLYRHKKRGTLYRIITIGRLQIAGDCDMSECVTYEDVHDGSVWTRLKSEFFDGRFEEVPECDAEVVGLASGVDPRKEAVRQALKREFFLGDGRVLNGDRLAEVALKAADEAAWQPIELAPRNNKVLAVCCMNWPLIGPRRQPPVKAGGWSTARREWVVFGASWVPTHFSYFAPPPLFNAPSSNMRKNVK